MLRWYKTSLRRSKGTIDMTYSTSCSTCNTHGVAHNAERETIVSDRIASLL
jgi:hypothetical protein